MTSSNGRGRRGTALAVAALVIVLAGCGSQAKTVEVKKNAAPSPRTVILASIRTTAAAKSARISMRVSAGESGAGSFALTADGVTDFTTGDGTLTMQFTGSGSELLSGGIEVRSVDGAAYVKMPESLGMFGGGKWLKTPVLDDAGGALPGVGQSNPSQFLAYLETVSDGVKQVGSDSIRGVETTHYKASLDLTKAVDRAHVPASLRDDLRELFKKFNSGSSAIPADVWVDGEGLARRIQMKLDLSSIAGTGSSSTLTMSMDLYDFGVPVHVEAPPAGDTEPFPLGPSGAGGAAL